MLYIFEMANNHMGSVEHAKRIVDEFAVLVKKYKLTAGIKLQFRQLDTFIHKDSQNSEIKHIKRFRETRLTKEQFSEIVEYIRSKELLTIATPFDNESLRWIKELNIDILKIASTSIDDWPLLREASQLDKRAVISTGGADFNTLEKVYSLFKKARQQFAFMHCIGVYPTPHTQANLSRITALKEAFPDIEIGISTHESPKEQSIVPYAAAMGCTIIEKHVGIKTSEFNINDYTVEPADMEKVVQQVEFVQNSLRGKPEPDQEEKSLRSLKRGIYAKRDLETGSIVQAADIYFAMPCQDKQLDASQVDRLIGNKLKKAVKKDEALEEAIIKKEVENEQEILNEIQQQSLELLRKAHVALTSEDLTELSIHYGLKRFFEVGTLLITKFNREYCKKLVVMLAGQEHPIHYHNKKEEVFELLYGDCELILDGKSSQLEVGKPVVIERGAKHALKTRQGCVIEEISTAYKPGDSFYPDPEIAKLKLSDRKLRIALVRPEVT